MLTRTNIALALGAFIGSATYADVKEWDPIAGNLFWSTAENWTPTGVPQANDTVYIDGSYTVLLDTDTASLTDVLIHGGASVGTNGFSLTALTPSCGASSVREPGSALTVSPASGLALALDHLFVEDGALLSMAGGEAFFNVNLDVDVTSTLRGRGTLSSDGSLRVAGLAEAIGGALIFDAPSVDLDGPVDTSEIIVAAGASLVVNGPMADSLDSETTLYQGSSFESAFPWTYGGGDGSLDVFAGNGEASVDGAAFANLDNIYVETGRFRIASEDFVNETDARITLLPGTTLVIDNGLENHGRLSIDVAVASVANGLYNLGLIDGNGLLDANFLRNDGTISASGGSLAMVFTSSPDLDGSSESGAIEVIQGDLSIVTPQPNVHSFDGSLIIVQDRVLDLGPNLGIDFESAQVDITGGTLQAMSVDMTNPNADIRIRQGQPTQITTTDGTDLGVAQLDGDLLVAGPASLDENTSLSGSGTLAFLHGGVVDADDDAFVGVNTEFAGTFAPGAGERRRVTFGEDVIFRDGSTTVIDLTTDGYDRIESNGTAVVDGTLRVDLAPGFQPALGDQFPIIDPALRVGTFADLELPPGLVVQYGAGIVRLVAQSVCPGDIVPDGVIDVDDLVLLLTNWGGGPGNPADVDGDGSVGTNDLITILANWGECI